MDKLAVVALGGNAIIKEGQKGTIEEQYTNVMQFCEPVIELVQQGYNVVLVHGNGPQVGNVLLKVEAAYDIVVPNPLDICGAETQGNLGYIIQQVLSNSMMQRGMDKKAVTVITRVVVDKNDPAFQNPTKPIGPFYKKEVIEELTRGKDIVFVEDSGRGYRRVVASPKPIEIIEKDAVNSLLVNGYIVITAGGGGIPVVKESGKLRGVEAVIDKDYAAALLAQEIKANYLYILTGVEQVAINYGKHNQKMLSQITVSEAKKYLHEGHFPSGSMGPKIEAAINFIEKGGNKAIITSANKFLETLRGESGTRITKDLG